MPLPSAEQRGQVVRRKVALACQACRERKTRCDGAKPMCGGCQRRRYTQDRCIYTSIENAKSASGKEYIRVLHERIRRLESRLPNPNSPPSTVSSASPATDTSGTSLSGGERQGGITDLVSLTTQRTRQIFDGSESNQCQNDAIVLNATNAVKTTEGPYQQPQFENSLGGISASMLNGAAEDFNSASSTLASAVQHQSQPTGYTYFRNEGDNNETPPFESATPNILGGPTPHLSDHEDPINAMGTALALPDEIPGSREKFYGKSSAVSFLYQIRDTANQHSRKSEPAQQSTSSRNFQKRIPLVYGLSNDASGSYLEHYYLPPRTLAEHLLGCYWDRVHCLYPFVHKPTFTSAYNQLFLAEKENHHFTIKSDAGLGGSNCSNSVFYCALNAMLALGCQFSDMQIEKRESLAASFFRRSMDLLQINILDDGNMALLQTLLIVAQYLQSTQLPSRCWNIVGLAVRVAQGLGLYSDTALRPVHGRGFLETEIRRRTWHGCVTLDMVVSMTLGRPAIINPGSMVPLPLAIDDEYMDDETITSSQPAGTFSRTAFFVETVKLYDILGKVLTKVYKPWNETDDREKGDGDNIPGSPSTATIIALDSAMNELEAKLPWELRWNRPSSITGPAAEVYERQTNVLHARFLHLRILLYRPTLNRLCRSFHLSSSQGSSSASTTQRAPVDGTDKSVSEFRIFCSMTCIEAAQDLIKLIDQSSQTSFTGAWWYNIFYLSTSAMVLILAEIWRPASRTLSENSLMTSWQQCLDALARITSSNNAGNECAKTLIALRQLVSSNNGNHVISADESRDFAGGVQLDESCSVGWMDFDLQSDINLADILCRPASSEAPWNLEDTMSWQPPVFDPNVY